MIDSFTGEYRFLSNFYEHPVTYDGITYPTNEHAFVAQKTTNLREREYVASTIATPGRAKRYGRGLVLRRDWEAVKVSVMNELLVIKFAPPSELAWQLAMTGGTQLVEGNTWHDQYWGDCRCGQPRCVREGVNMLGRLLMAVRSAVQSANVVW